MSGTLVTSDWGRGSLTVTWAVAQCSLIMTDHGPRGACCLHLQSWWRQKVCLTHWYCYTRLHSVIHQKTLIFRRTSGLTRCISSLHDAHRPQGTANKGFHWCQWRQVCLVLNLSDCNQWEEQLRTADPTSCTALHGSSVSVLPASCQLHDIVS
jgi:hypothetical protein